MANFKSLQSLIDNKDYPGGNSLVYIIDSQYYQKLPIATMLFSEEINPLRVSQYLRSYTTQIKTLEERGDGPAIKRSLRAALYVDFYWLVFGGENQEGDRKAAEILNCCPVLNEHKVLEEILQSKFPEWVIYGFHLLTDCVELLTCNIYNKRCLKLRLKLELGGTCDFVLRYPQILCSKSRRNDVTLRFNGDDSSYSAEEHLADGTPTYRVITECSPEGDPFSFFNVTKTYFCDEEMS